MGRFWQSRRTTAKSLIQCPRCGIQRHAAGLESFKAKLAAYRIAPGE